MKVTARARSRDDRAGDPLDGLVNLFDLGIVLSVAFLLAALSSLDLTSALTGSEAQRAAGTAADAVVAGREERVRPLRLTPGERVVGRGERLGEVYRLADGRTVIVEPRRQGSDAREAGDEEDRDEAGGGQADFSP